MKAPLAERFWLSVDMSGGADACWPWMGPRGERGYGVVKDDHGAHRGAHRKGWELHHGVPAPPDMCVCHACDFPPCCNPAHLWLGTHQQNRQDFINKDLPRVRRRLSLMWHREPPREHKKHQSCFERWMWANPDKVAEAKRYVTEHRTWRDQNKGLRDCPQTRDGVRYYDIRIDDPIGVPENLANCAAVVVGQGDREGTFYQCRRPRRVGDLCTQHFNVKQG